MGVAFPMMDQASPIGGQTLMLMTACGVSIMAHNAIFSWALENVSKGKKKQVCIIIVTHHIGHRYTHVHAQKQKQKKHAHTYTTRTHSARGARWP